MLTLLVMLVVHASVAWDDAAINMTCMSMSGLLAYGSPIQAPEEWVTPYAWITDKSRRTMAGMASCMDAEIERIVGAFKAASLWESTLFVFAADSEHRTAHRTATLATFPQKVVAECVVPIVAHPWPILVCDRWWASLRCQLELPDAWGQMDDLVRACADGPARVRSLPRSDG